ncbi:MAG: hypothetical protein CMF46_01355 [Legionellales bacterium]|nr:hypothetical protein [Legionellales bacterium]
MSKKSIRGYLSHLLATIRPGSAVCLTEICQILLISKPQLIHLMALIRQEGRDDFLIDSKSITRQLNSPCLLDGRQIAQALNRLNITVTTAVECENTMVLAKQCSSYPALYLAESQNSGTGQQSNYWHSPFCGNIYATFSLKRSLSRHYPISFFNIAAAVAIQRYLTAELKHISATIKWPNDHMVNHKKISGMIIFSQVVNHLVYLDIGIGVNVNLISDPNKRITQPWTSLSLETGQTHDPNQAVITLTKALFYAFEELRTASGRQTLVREFNQHLYDTNQLITQGESHVHFKGIHECGSPILEPTQRQKTATAIASHADGNDASD